MAILVYILVFLLGFAADFLTVEWHKSRENLQISRTVALSMALETLTWIPVILFVVADDPIVALVAVLASGFGTRAGMVRITREHADPIVKAPVCVTGVSCAPPVEDCSHG